MRDENYSAQMNLNTIFPFSIIVHVRPSLNKTWRVWYGCFFLFISGKLIHVFIGSWKLNSCDFDVLLFNFVYFSHLIRIEGILKPQLPQYIVGTRTIKIYQTFLFVAKSEASKRPSFSVDLSEKLKNSLWRVLNPELLHRCYNFHAPRHHHHQETSGHM